VWDKSKQCSLLLLFTKLRCDRQTDKS